MLVTTHIHHTTYHTHHYDDDGVQVKDCVIAARKGIEYVVPKSSEKVFVPGGDKAADATGALSRKLGGKGGVKVSTQLVSGFIMWLWCSWCSNVMAT